MNETADHTSIAGGATPRIGRGFRLQWEEAQQTYVLLYPEGMVKLNGSAGAILSRCDGVRTLDVIVSDLEHTYETSGLAGEVRAFAAVALNNGWLEITP